MEDKPEQEKDSGFKIRKPKKEQYLKLSLIGIIFGILFGSMFTIPALRIIGMVLFFLGVYYGIQAIRYSKNKNKWKSVLMGFGFVVILYGSFIFLQSVLGDESSIPAYVFYGILFAGIIIWLRKREDNKKKNN